MRQHLQKILKIKKLENILSDLSRKVALRARKNGLGGKTINLKLKQKTLSQFQDLKPLATLLY